MIPYKSAKHQSGFSVPSKVLRFFKRKQHFLRLGIRGLVVRLQQESTFENSTRLITDWTIKLVQCKVIPNQDQIWQMRRFCSLEFGHFRMSKQSSFHWIRSGRKAEFGQSSLCSPARWHRQGWALSDKLSTCTRVHPDSGRAEGLMDSSAGRWAHFWTAYCGCKCVSTWECRASFQPLVWGKLGTGDNSCNTSAEMWSHNLKITLVQSFGEHYHHNNDK